MPDSGFDFREIIAAKRDGEQHSRADFDIIANGAAMGTIPDYQLSAWLMAAYLNGLTDHEAADLTLAMAASGERLDLSDLPRPWVDKHSTGGVGDKTTIVLLPILAACGLSIIKLSGTGLGITGGTVDKLGAIPGLRLDLSPEEMVSQAKQIGIGWSGQSPKLAPADKALYAIRDATTSVESMPLIASSILSKKIAVGAEALALDIKCGSGAFMPDLGSARRLGHLLRSVGEKAGLRIVALISDMEQPLGRTAGNALEVKEAIQVLSNRESGRFVDLCLEIARATLQLVGIDADPAETLRSGSALAKFREWILAQGGSPEIFESESWQTATVQTEVATLEEGFVHAVNARDVGEAVVLLGGGRRKKSDSIDPTVGIETIVEVGMEVRSSQPLFRVHAADVRSAARVVEHLRDAVVIRPEPVPPRSVVLDII